MKRASRVVCLSAVALLTFSVTGCKTLDDLTAHKPNIRHAEAMAIGLGLGFSSSGVPATGLPGLPTVDLTKGPMSFQVDGNTLINEGSALFQQAQILDNQISKAFFPKNYRVHLLTLQVSVQPKQRDVDYDVYVDVSLLPSNWQDAIDGSSNLSTNIGALPPIVIYPLVITDAMELTNVGRSLETIRQAALQLSGMIGQVGANFGAGSGQSKLNAVIGLNKNSLVTVGRINNNSLRIRLGAENSGSAGLSLVPRVYNVSLAVMTFWGSAGGREVKISSLQAVTHSHFISTEDGSALTPGRDRLTLAQHVKGLTEQFGYRPVKDAICAPGETANPHDPDYLLKESYLNLLRGVDRQAYKFVQDCMGIEESELKDAQKQLKFRRFVAEASELQYDALYADFHIPLKPGDNALAPDASQIVLYSDDNKATTKFILRGGKGLDGSNTDNRAYLFVRQASASTNAAAASAIPAHAVAAKSKSTATPMLLASALTITGDGAEIDVAFPSLKKAGLVPSLDADTNKSLCVEFAQLTKDKRQCYTILAGPLPAKEVKNPVSVSSAALVADRNNVARITVQVGAIDAGTSLVLTVDGADVRADSSIGAIAMSSKGIALSANTVFTLELGNLSTTKAVSLTTTDTGSKETVGSVITLPVTYGAGVGH